MAEDRPRRPPGHASSSRSSTTRSTPTAAASPRTPTSAAPAKLEGLLANNNVGIAFNGHAHHYERNFPQIAGKPLVSYVTGGGGAALGSVSTCSAFDAYAIGSSSSCRAPKPASDANVYHFLLVTVNGSQVTVTPDRLDRPDVRRADVHVLRRRRRRHDSADGAREPDRGRRQCDPGRPGWTASTDNVGVTGYTITRNGAAADDHGRHVDDVRDTTAAPNTTYTYSVQRDRRRGQPLAGLELGDGDDAAGGAATFTFTPTDDAYVDQVVADDQLRRGRADRHRQQPGRRRADEVHRGDRRLHDRQRDA